MSYCSSLCTRNSITNSSAAIHHDCKKGSEVVKRMGAIELTIQVLWCFFLVRLAQLCQKKKKEKKNRCRVEATVIMSVMFLELLKWLCDDQSIYICALGLIQIECKRGCVGTSLCLWQMLKKKDYLKLEMHA